MNQNQNQIKFKDRPTLIIGKEFLSMISYFHSKETVEWSGALFYSVVSGNIEDPSNLVLKAEYVHLMDIGSAAYTEYDITGENFLSVFENDPTIEDRMMNGELMVGFLHTHHQIATNPSSTDDAELLDNCKFFPFYLSLIVNYACKYNARIAIKGKYKKKVSENCFKFSNVEKSFSLGDEETDQEVIAVMDCDIKFDIPESIEKQYTKVKTTFKPVVNTYNYKPANNYKPAEFQQNGNKKSFNKNYAEFTSNWLLNEKGSKVFVYEALQEFDKLFKKYNKKEKERLLESRQNSFPRYVQSYIDKKANKEELNEFAKETISWLKTYYRQECVEGLIDILQYYILPVQSNYLPYGREDFDIY